MEQNFNQFDTCLLIPKYDQPGQKLPLINFSNKTSGELLSSDNESEKEENFPIETKLLVETEFLEIQEHAKKRAESLSTQTDRSSLNEQNTLKAIKRSVDPIKITWTDINYTVVVPTANFNKFGGKVQTKTIQVL